MEHIAALDANVPAYLDFLKRIVRMETPSNDKQALDEMVTEVIRFAESRGFACERIPFERAGDCIRVTAPKQGVCKHPEKVFFMAHMDTVHPKRLFGKDVLTEEGDILHGPGVSDCKGGLVVGLLAAETLVNTGYNDRPIELLFTTDEEVSGILGGEAGINLIRDSARGAFVALNLETGMEDGYTVGRKGIAVLNVTVRGKAGHAGNDYFASASAIKEAAHQILAIEAMSAPDGCTFNCGVISGGTTFNAVPAKCEFTVDIRGIRLNDLTEAVEKVRKLAETVHVPGTSVEVSVHSTRPPMEHVEANDRLFEKINASGIAHGFHPMKPIIRGGGSDAAYTVEIGIPTVCSLGLVGDAVHSVRETGRISSLAERAAVLTFAIREL